MGALAGVLASLTFRGIHQYFERMGHGKNKAYAMEGLALGFLAFGGTVICVSPAKIAGTAGKAAGLTAFAVPLVIAAGERLFRPFLRAQNE